MRISYKIPFPVRFDLQHIPVTESGCWLWIGDTNPDGYGRINFNKKLQLAHRVSWTVHCGNIPAGMHVCHKCDTPQCVNPSHLFIGDNAANHADKILKGRQGTARGECSGVHKLTDIQISEIREIGTNLSSAVVADLYGITPRYVCQLRNNQWRKHHG